MEPEGFDSLLDQVGSFNRYQIGIYFMLCLPASLPSAWTAFNQVFVAAIPEHWCKFPKELRNSTLYANLTIEELKNLTIPREIREGRLQYSRCQIYTFDNATNVFGISTTTKCHEWEYDKSTYETTITSQFDLVCDNGYWPSLSTTAFYIGSFIGNILFGYIADRWGRRASFFTIILVQVVFGTANAFAPNIISFILLRFVVGFSFPALYQIPFIIGMEFMGAEGRIFAGMVVCVFFGISMCLLGVVASLIRQWSTLTIICNTPFAILLLYYWILPESPRWLMTAKRYKEAHKILLRVAKVNGKVVDSDRLLQQCRQEALRDGVSAVHHQNRPNILNLFKFPRLRRKTMIITYIWFVNAVVYNGLTYNVSNLPVNDYLSFAINGAVEVPAYFIIWPLLNKIGRRWPLCISMFLGGLACIATMLVSEDQPWIISGLAFLGKFGIAASFAVLYIFAGELYPTVERAIGMGMSSMVAGGGLIIAPYMVMLGQYVRILPLLVMGTLTLSAGVASMFLPETLGAQMPQTLIDAENYGKDFTFCYCPTRRQNMHNCVNSNSNLSKIQNEEHDNTQNLMMNHVQT